MDENELELRDVTSSNLAQVGYDPDTKTLRIVFKSGAVYDYSNVDEQTYRHLLQSKSLGKFFNAYIKNTFSYARVR